MLALPSPAVSVVVAAQPGQVFSLRVALPPAQSGVLLNHEAPNLLTLSTPWGQAQTGLTGRALTTPAELRGYYGQLDPVLLRLRLPAQIRPGRYSGQVALQLFTCDRRANLCQQRKLSYALDIRVASTHTSIPPGNVLTVPVGDLQGRTPR